MKQAIIHFFLIILLTMGFPFHTSGENKVINFNFPQDVSREALADLNKALKSGDGQQTVDALVRYSIAQSGISKDNMPDIIKQIEATINKEKRPMYKALLNYFEAIVYQGYRDQFARWTNRKNPDGEMPDDVSEWDRNQFNAKIAQLLEASLTDSQALKQVPVTSLPDIIKCNTLGATYCPTLLEFMLMKNLEVYQTMDGHEQACKELKNKWLQATEGNLPAHIYAMAEAETGVNIDNYNKYKDSEYSALLLDKLSFDNAKQGYKLLNEYITRHPNSIFTPGIKNRITEMESRAATVRYPSRRSTRDSIPITVDVKNANSFSVNIYRIPLGMVDEYRIDVSRLEIVKQFPMTAQGTVPFEQKNIQATLPTLPYGAYVLCCGDLGKNVKSGNMLDIYNYDVLRVTDLAPITISRIDGKDHVAAVDINTGKPLPGVTINYQVTDRFNAKSGTIGTTGANGLVALPEFIKNPDDSELNIDFDRVMLTAIKGKDTYSEPIYYYKMHQYNNSSENGNIYTDLGVYRPGETVHWAAIAYRTDSDSRTPLAERQVTVIFMDKNHEPIDTLQAITDAFGRIEGEFAVPKDRLNGQFSILMKSGDGSRYSQILARQYINVSEYKTPTFAVSFPDARRSYTIGQPVKVSGKVETYSGMPVANTRVRLSLIEKEWSWWWWRVTRDDGNHLMDTTVTTDAQGVFNFTFQPELFKENQSRLNRWSRYNYQLVATATNDAGETQEEATRFIVGTRRGIELGNENDNIYLNDKPIKLPLVYKTTDEQNTATWCTWEVAPQGAAEPVLTGNLNTDDPTIDLTSLPSGLYTLKLHILDAQEGEQDVDIARDIVLYRKTDKQAPVKDCPLWIAPQDKRVDKNNTGHINVGVSAPKAYIYYIAATATKVVAEGWLNYNKGMNDFTVPLPREAGADVTVQFISFYNTKYWQQTVTLTNPYKVQAMNITATSFRDKLAPGDIEHWTFSLTDQNGKPHQGAMLLDMFDKAIASIAPNDWRFTNWRRGGIVAHLSANSLARGASTNNYWIGTMLDLPDAINARLPELYTYDQSIFGRYMSRRLGVNRAMKGEDSMLMMSRTAAAPESKAMEMNDVAYGSYEEAAEQESVEQPVVNEKNLDKVQLRESDVKTALWMPMLTTDARGNIQVEFEVPNFNTTWITQAVAWDHQMVGSQWMAEVLTQKPLMVRSSMPRFLRQGDKAALAATVQNATDQAAQCDAVIELFDPRSGDIYATRKFNLQLEPMGSQAVTIDWVVPDTISMMGFRIKAANGRYGDGEQVMVPVLTTISPVIETEPFYIEAAQGHFETALPQFPNDARVTLEYCDNPVWYCVLALPTIFSDNYYVSTHAAHSLFALQVAQGVAKAQPQIKEAVNYWKQHNEDSTLVSMLQKNQDLKIGTLLASPWMREADRQTLRMTKLHELFDEAIVKREYEKIITALQSLQMEDGGFTWFRHPDCKSSIWTTGTVLEILGEIQHMGFLPQDNRLTSMLERALKYYDNKNVERFHEIKKYNKNPYSLFTGYAYTRSLYPDVKQSGASANLLKKTVKFMDKNWDKGISLNQKGFYAMTLDRNGYHKTATSIIESIRQFAIVKPNLGMYWDNLQTGYGWWEFDKVAYTSTILRAMNEVDPRQQEIDLVRKWMLLMKQSNDWGSYSLAADAVYSILSTGSLWLERASTPAITVAGQPVAMDKLAQWLGYVRTTIPATTTGNVVIDRTAKGPAWGAVYSQFQAPMTQISEKGIDEVTISKEYYTYAQDGTLHSATSFKVGDKVKVRMIIKVNKDMDFVTITDERASCFEPVDQLSGYRSEDRTWFYQETKDTQTNVFINSLNKGTHIIGYDVWVTNPGEFTSGIATIQCQYAPQLTAHSAGKSITVKR